MQPLPLPLPQHNQGQKAFSEKSRVFIMLSCDASPQNGVDFQMTLEDMVERKRCLAIGSAIHCVTLTMILVSPDSLVVVIGVSLFVNLSYIA